MKTLRRTAAGAAIALALGAASPALAYVRSTSSTGAKLKWPSSCVPILAYAGSPPARMTVDSFKKAVTAATAAWGRAQVGCSGLKLVVEYSPEADGPAARDGTSRIVFRRDKWCRKPADAKMTCYDPSVLAVTTVTSSKADGTILDADIEINAVDYKWDDMTVKGVAPGAQDFQTMLTHELGHLMGLDHSCFVTGQPPVDHLGKEAPNCAHANTAVKATIMYPKVTNGELARTLASDERKALCDIYPLASVVQNCTYATALRPDAGALPIEQNGDDEEAGDEAGGCSVGRRGSPSGAWLLAAAALWLTRRRRHPRCR